MSSTLLGVNLGLDFVVDGVAKPDWWIGISVGSDGARNEVYYRLCLECHNPELRPRYRVFRVTGEQYNKWASLLGEHRGGWFARRQRSRRVRKFFQREGISIDPKVVTFRGDTRQRPGVSYVLVPHGIDDSWQLAEFCAF